MCLQDMTLQDGFHSDCPLCCLLNQQSEHKPLPHLLTQACLRCASVDPGRTHIATLLSDRLCVCLPVSQYMSHAACCGGINNICLIKRMRKIRSCLIG